MAQLQVYSNKLAFTHALCADNRDSRHDLFLRGQPRPLLHLVLRGPPRRFRLRVQAISGQPRHGSIIFFPRGQPQPMPISANFCGPPRYFKPSFYTWESI